MVEDGATIEEAIATLATPGDLNLADIFGAGQPDAAYLAALNGAGITDFDINGDDVINRFDLAVTATTTDDVTVFNDLAAISDAAIEWSSTDPRYNAADRTITFNGVNWDDPVLIELVARDDGIREDPQTAVITFSRDPLTTGQPDYIFPNLRSGLDMLDIEVIDDETAGSIVLESGGDTVLIPDGVDTDSYDLRLTKRPEVGEAVDVAILTDGLADVHEIRDENGVVIPTVYETIGGLRPTQKFFGSLIFSDDSGQGTITRGEGAELGSFLADGWDVGDLIRIGNSAYDANNDDIIDGDFDGDYEIAVISEDGQTITLTTALPAPAGGASFPFEVLDTVVLAELAEEDVWTGEVYYDRVEDPQLTAENGGVPVLTDRIIRPEAAEEGSDVEGWLAQGFVEGQRVRITNMQTGHANFGNSVDAKIAIIRGLNDTKDSTLQFTGETDGGLPTWLTDASDTDPIKVEVNRIAKIATFTDTDWYKQQEIVLKADTFYDVPPTREGTKVFPVQAHRLSKLRGPLAVEGGTTGADRSLTNGVKLPGEKDDFLIAIGTQAPESQQIDVLNIFNDGSKANTKGVMDETTLRGFGMAEDLTFPDVTGPLYGEGSDTATPQDLVYPGGISFGKINFGAGGAATDGSKSTIEVVNLMLGEGNDYLQIDGTLNPAEFVSAEQVFAFYDIGEDPEANLPAGNEAFERFATDQTVRRDGFDWKAEGFLVGQTVFIDGYDRETYSWEIAAIEDAIEYFDGSGNPIINPDTGAPYRDPNDNSVLVLTGPAFSTLPGFDESVAQKLIAVDELVIATVTTTVATTSGGGTLTRSGNWADDGFLEGHLLNIGPNGVIGLGAGPSVRYRVVSIEYDEIADTSVMEVKGDPLAVALGLSEDPETTETFEITDLFWVQGPHGSLTTIHGGGNLPVSSTTTFDLLTSEEDAASLGSELVITHLDGRSFQLLTDNPLNDDRFEVGQVVQLAGEAHTRQVLEIRDADPDDFGIVNPFLTWGEGGQIVLSAPLAGVDTPYDEQSEGTLFVSQPEVTTETVENVDIRVDRLIRTDGGSWDDNFDIGNVVFIDGIAGGFTINNILDEDGTSTMVLANAALDPCNEGGVTVTITTTDITTTDTSTPTDGARVGGDHFVVTGGAGPESPLVLYGDTSQDGVWYSGHPNDRLGLEFGDKPFDPFPQLTDEENEDDEWIFPLANPFAYHGNDIIDASQLFAAEADAGTVEELGITVGVTAYGGRGDDRIIGSQVGDHLAGGSGNDTIIGQRGVDHIYGDSGVNVNIFTRALQIATNDNSPLPSVDKTLEKTDSTFKPVASPELDDLVAGDDVIVGNGSGILDGDPDVMFGDHGAVIQNVVNPNLPDPILPYDPANGLKQKIQTTTLDSILAILSKELQNGGDDTVIGAEIDDVLIGGAGNDMIDGLEGDDLIFGDNVYLTRMGGADGNLIDDIESLRFQTLLGTYLYSRSDRPLPGMDPDNPASFPGELASGQLLTDGIARNYRDPNGPQWWAEYEIQYADLHTFEFDAGNDYIAGGQDHDQIFGQLGDDVIQGDGSIGGALAALRHVGASRDPGGPEDPIGPLTVIAANEDVDVNGLPIGGMTDGLDYIEGSGGCDVIFGGLGQDDLVGGSSSFFSLDDPNSRPDGDDKIFGGTGEEIDRNNGFDPEADTDGDDDNHGEDVVLIADTSFEDKHARDSDVIVGDNGNIIRIVGINSLTDTTPDVNYGGDGSGPFDPSSPLYVSFNYDNYDDGMGPDGEKIIVRGITLLDYTAGGPDFAPSEFSLVDPANTPDPSDDDMREMFEVKVPQDDGTYVRSSIWARSDIGGHDEVHGEASDDFIYLGGGNDVAFGDADDDDIIGGWGHDWLSGGTGIDGVLGDDGRIFTSRNTSDELLAESLYGVEALLDRDPDTRTSQGNVLNELIRTPGNVHTELINVEGALKKSVDLTPYNPTGFNVFGGNPQDAVHLFADDIIFGGLGDDFLHGGAGDDAISGAEALLESYAPRIEGSMMDEDGQERDILGLVRIDFTRPHNPNHGNVLLFGADTDPWNDPKPVRSRLGEFYLYNEYDPRRVILFHEDNNGDTVVWNGDILDGDFPLLVPGGNDDLDLNPDLKQYFLNNADDEGVSELGYVAFEPNGQTPDPDVPPEFRQSDGDDAIFGDLGNDWIVGGTGRDRAYGGFGNDLLQADDVLGTVNPDPPQNNPGQLPLGGTDETPDTHWLYEDRFFGGGGLDILIGNTKGDRLIDWVGEFNSYIVPFASFGIPAVSRQVPPHLFDFLYAQAFGDGVDFTRTSDTGTVNHKDKYSNVALHMGGVDGEIGLVTQQDHGYWQDQTGGPTDPQAGNVPGGRRDVLRTSDFNNASMDLFIRDKGNAQVAGGQLLIAAESKSTQATLFYNLDAYLPIYYEVRAKLSADKPTGGNKANAYIIFDYQSDIDFKYAGLNISNDKIEMGYRDETGWHEVVQSTQALKLKPDIQYDVLVAVNGTNVTLVIDGVEWFTYTYDPRLDEDGLPIPLNKGFVGVGMDGGSGSVDNFTVQVLPPEMTLEVVDDFSGPDAADVFTPATGNWTLSGGKYSGAATGVQGAVSLADLGADIAVSSILELEGTIAHGGVGGFAFDYYGPNDFKFITLDATNDQIIVGHVDLKSGLSIDETYSKTLDDNGDNTLKLSFSGAAVNISANNSFVDTYGFNAALVDGDFGLVSMDGTTDFNDVAIRTNDPTFAGENLLAAGAPAIPVGAEGAITAAQLAPVLDAAVANWTASGFASGDALDAVQVELVDLPGLMLARAEDDTILLDIDAAGYGWFIDVTPYDDAEFVWQPEAGSLVASDDSAAYGRMDLLTVVMHELGHVLGFDHYDDAEVMHPTLDSGVRYSIDDENEETDTALSTTTTADAAASAPAANADTQDATVLVFDDASGLFQSGDDTPAVVPTESYVLDRVAFGPVVEDESDLDKAASSGQSDGYASSESTDVGVQEPGFSTTDNGSLIDWNVTFEAPVAPLATSGNGTGAPRGLVQFPEFVADPLDKEASDTIDNGSEDDEQLVLQTDAGSDVPTIALVNASSHDSRGRQQDATSG